MKLRSSLLLALLLVAILLPASPAQAQGIQFDSNGCAQTIVGTAQAVICLPENWNGDLVVYAHGYVEVGAPSGTWLQQLFLPGGTSIPEMVLTQGFAFAATGYSVDGLAVVPAIQDLLTLVDYFKNYVGSPSRVYLTGVSEGGLISTLALEQYPDTFDAGLAACGPIGDFRRQVNYFGDFRVIFDYFFPGILPGSPIEIPGPLMENWATPITGYQNQVFAEIVQKPEATAQLLTVTKAPFNPLDQTTIGQTVAGVLWYNVFATNDATAKMGGNPYNNKRPRTYYTGSLNDRLLNETVYRVAADKTALKYIQKNLQTSGDLQRPLVTLHTTGDPIIPYWQEALYAQKVFAEGKGYELTSIPVLRYGHCAFTSSEALFAFSLMVYRVTHQWPTLQNIQSFLPEASAQAVYKTLEQNYLNTENPIYLPRVSQ